MFIRNIFKVIFLLIICWCVLYIYQSRTIIFPTTVITVQVIVENLIDLQLYFQQQIIQFIQLKYCKQDYTLTKVNNRSDIARYAQNCPQHRYTSRIIERSPLIIYIERFLTQNEIQHLIQLAEPLFKPSLVYEDSGSESSNEHRTSTTALLKRHQTPIVKCIEERFAQFEGDIELDHIEPLQIVKYGPDQQFKPHYDWFPHDHLLKNGGQRVTTFFTYLQANCSRGETEFIDIQFNKTFHERFCDILVCNADSEKHGLRFRPLPGNSIFWFNMDEHAQVDYLTYHTGHPPGKNGYKIGLNTWTRETTFFPPFEN